MGCKARSFYRLQNKEQGGDKQKISLWLGPQSQAGLEKAGSRLGIWGVADWTHRVSAQTGHVQGQES